MVPLLMFDIIIKNYSGVSAVAWGTPLKTRLFLLIPPGILTLWVMLVRNWKNLQLYAKFTCDAHVLSLCNNMSCSCCQPTPPCLFGGVLPYLK